MVADTNSRGFSRYAWAFLAYLIAVILFGAWVRITHSGAGCGSLWPTCHGELVPLAPSLETVIEYTHRLTSGLLGIFGLALVGWAALRPRGRILVAAIVTLFFIVLEGAVGAGLVLEELVVDDDSAARAIVISFHLVNTLMLTGAASLTAFWSHDRRPMQLASLGGARWLLVATLVALVVTSMTGAVTALGDTIFPVNVGAAEGLLARVRDDLSATQHFLVRLRIVHPAVAMAVAFGVYWVAGWIRERATSIVTVRIAGGLRHAVLTQAGLGLLNVGLAAPGWMQLLHLLMAQVVWIAAVLALASFAAEVRAVPPGPG